MQTGAVLFIFASPCLDLFCYNVINEYLWCSLLTCPGIIRTALPNMDREAKEEYHVVIQAKDMGGHMGGLSGTTKVTITLTDVNDNPPKFPQSKSVGLVFTFQWCHSQLSSMTHPCYTQLSRRNLE